MVLLSGGLDSATCLALALHEGLEVFALTVAYGQRHTQELVAARRFAATPGVVEHRVVDIDLSSFGGSSLTGDGEVPTDGEPDRPGIPTTYVPARNTVLLAHALAWAEVLGARDLFIGVNAVDFSGYPDCRPEFVAAFEAVANVGTRAGAEGRGYRVRAPLIDLGKADIVRLGVELGVDHAGAVSCYDPTDGGACGRCDACVLRRRGFAEAGIADPTPYR